jgi:hypothetical protein
MFPCWIQKELKVPTRVADFRTRELFKRCCTVTNLEVTSEKNIKLKIEAKRDDENFAYVAAWNTKETK